MEVIGFHENNESYRFRKILSEIAPNALDLLEKKGLPVLFDSGQCSASLPTWIFLSRSPVVYGWNRNRPVICGKLA